MPIAIIKLGPNFEFCTLRIPEHTPWTLSLCPLGVDQGLLPALQPPVLLCSSKKAFSNFHSLN